jgi:hypothetical protein
VISARHEFYIVRGDAALLAAGQEARTDRWYIRRWDDLSTSTGLIGRIASIDAGAVKPTSWGSLKNSFYK